MDLKGKIIDICDLSDEYISNMFRLMDTFYENMNLDIFIKDLKNKDHCIILFDKKNTICGFSTQKIVNLNINNKQINGVFSGDTIIDKDYWGSMEIYKVFAKKYVNFAKNYDEFYWFLTSKGYKTYRILSSFFCEYYPSYLQNTPLYIKSIMNCFGEKLYREEYNPITGVIEYKNIKDRLKKGIADITSAKCKNKHIEFFQKVNPGHSVGNDLVCLASLNTQNLKSFTKRLILGE